MKEERGASLMKRVQTKGWIIEKLVCLEAEIQQGGKRVSKRSY